ncbi:MAG: hypothetical protein A3B14_03675 [Candidatus Zambryskibacteria bacterium RIFCSPLOWO2_01_FULL_45_21]|uniref:Uncharacterized protein n=1 Tax=Candidatus Zambryskibacteria bacterium RIFCSPLOWO2_01_FULL_45_21 TaxID=1802761 RepID=A0A1G2U5S1_9BACT|nr:MAG: hypothetical protein A3B14_03675 [Candidatus Zambryskibacteria bacterium RIFCSPLOWO2_01_FULL_45_21]
MKRTKFSQSGAGHLTAILAIVVIAIVGFTGYRVMNYDKPSDNYYDTSSPTQTNIPNITSKKDLNTASTTLNTVKLDADLNPADFDADVNDLL